MLKYIIYALVAALAVWAVWYLIRTVRRQLREGCGCGGDCQGCSETCKSCNEENRERSALCADPFSTVCFPCTLLSRPPSMVSTPSYSSIYKLLSGLVGDMDD